LDEADFVTVNFDAVQAGLGTATCGPGVLPQYLANLEVYNFDVTYRPINLQERTVFEYAAERKEAKKL
jgi:beta-galactosidase